MCGIAGLLSLKPIQGLASKVRRLSETLKHRGPDDVGFLSWQEGQTFSLGRDPDRIAPGRLALVHRRLSILDLSPLGWQPMLDTSGRRAIVFNGEIYNYRELRAELEAKGLHFRSHSDTEILLSILAREGTPGLGRLVGMYAFAYVDLDSRQVLLARDPLGIKPLHYALSEGGLAFASELSPLLEIGAARRLVDRAALFRYLRHAVTNHGGETLFADIRELEPGTAMEVSLDGELAPRLRRFWEPRPLGSVAVRTPGDAAATLLDILKRNVDLHLRADVKCAAALSGGVDSSGIVALMARQAAAGETVDVFTYVADEDRFRERHWAGVLAGQYGARIHEVHLDASRLADEVDGLILRQEQPFTTTSMWAQAHVYRAAHEAGFKIVLDGQGADEALAGYPVFRVARLEGLLRRGHLASAARLLRGLPAMQAATLLRAVAGLVPQQARGVLRRAIARPVVPPWLEGRWFGDTAVEMRDVPCEGATPLNSALMTAIQGSSLPMLLRYADRNAMTASVENRVPYLTTELISFALGLPDELLISSDGVLKSTLRNALRGIVPDAILDRRDKVGFETPEADWFRRHEAVRRLAEETARMPLPVCFAPQVRTMIAELGAGRTPFRPELWRIMNVVRWSKLFAVEYPDASGQAKAA